LILFINRPEFEQIDDDEFYQIFKTKSHNSSSKICLSVDQIRQKDMLEQNNEYHWNQIDNEDSDHLGIGTRGLGFYSAMIQKTVVSLIDTGIIKHLIDTRVMNIKIMPKNRFQQKSSSFQDVSIFFAFWMVFCGFSAVSFAIEYFLNTKTFNGILKSLFVRKDPKFLKFKFAKVQSILNDKTPEIYEKQEVTSNLLKQFRTRKYFEYFGAKVVAVDVHREYFEDNLNIFGAKITKLDIMDDIQYQQIRNLQSVLEILEQKI